ncbi:hypothetical protein, partial [Streptomyces sp. 8K308]|uniref:hypothetical protein n=1 Tax=Streptomyces sp. 8K308 TaxID=2530388 RepID=UPI001A9EA99E
MGRRAPAHLCLGAGQGRSLMDGPDSRQRPGLGSSAAVAARRAGDSRRAGQGRVRPLGRVVAGGAERGK